MPEHYTAEEIRDYWTRQAERHGQCPSASWSDRWAIELEIKTLLDYLSDGETVLDIGCANGYTSVHLALQRDITVRGLDFVPEMIREAELRLEDLPESLRTRLSFGVGDILDLRNVPDDEYDRAVVVRVIINLEDWSRQVRALKEVLRVVRPGGLALISEATIQGHQRLNAMREEWGLEAIPMPPFNRYVDQEALMDAVRPQGEVVDVVDFASSYYVGTRVVKPLLGAVTAGLVDAADPEMEWNRFCASLPAAGDYGTQKLFVVRKR